MNSRMWSNKKIIKFLNEVHIRPELWNVSISAYRDRKAKFNAWSEVAAQFNITPDVAYKKFRNLRTYAKTEHKKKGGKDISWFAYDAISFILSDDGSETKTTIVESQERDDDGPSEESSVSSEEPQPKATIMKQIKTQTPEPLERVQIPDSNYNGRNLSANSSFGEYVASKLNNYDSYTRSQVEFKISKILFDADMGMFRNPGNQFQQQFATYTNYSDQQGVSSGDDLKTQGNFIQTQESMPGPSNVR